MSERAMHDARNRRKKNKDSGFSSGRRSRGGMLLYVVCAGIHIYR